ncbi:MAG: hypothetical protein GXY82_02940 [Methanospirillum sp.]|nr:hypothetical protein [Methanospirillum sp.]
MAPVASYDPAEKHRAGPEGVLPGDEQRLDPKLERLTVGTAPAALPSYLFIGLPISFTIALGIILIGFNGAVTIESAVLLALGVIGILLVRFASRQS